MNENDALNQLLKGTYMGISIFENLKSQLQSETLHKEFDEILFALRIHEKSLIALLKSKGFDASYHVGIMGSITEFIENIKSKMLTSDKEVLESAIYNMRMAEKAILVYDDKYSMFDDGLIKIFQIMKEDYMSFYHKLNKYLIEFKR